jgi:ATP-binding cassette subfamily C protein
MIIPKLYGDILSKSRSGLSESLEKYNAKIKDLFSGFELIKSFQIEDQTRKLHQEVTGHVETSRYNFRSRYSRSLINQDVLVYLSAIVQLCFSVYLVIKGQITFGVLLGSMQVSNYVSNPLKQIGEQVLNLKAANGIKEKIEQIINDETDVETINEKSVTIDRATPIVLEHVSFSYDGNKVNLSDINLQFHKGKKYAIVGSSGSGKSTLLKLVMNYFDTYEGKILLGNQLLSEIDKNSYYQHFSTIHQNVFMFDDTILNNITLFQKYSDEAVMQAVRRSGLEELVSLLPLGLETRINEGGNNLSGGEQQRIAIARALLRNSEVLLVDEATSSLDNELSMKIESLILAQNGLTAIVVTHKLVESLLCKYDYIIAMRDGAVEEFGTFDSLIEMNGYFRSLYEINR